MYGPYRSRKEPSRGFALLMILVCLMIASAMLASIFKSTIAMQRFTQSREWRIQAEWLVESGVERAAAKLAENTQYQGETWLLSADQLGGDNEALVFIEVTADPGQPRRRLVSVRADYPNHPLHRASLNKQVPVQLPEEPVQLPEDTVRLSEEREQ
jgi:Tfp pilus assembly protein PilV